MFNESILSFRKFCMQSTILPADLHIKLSDIAKGFGMSYLNYSEPKNII